MTLVSGGVSIRPVDQHTELLGRRRSWWTPRWLQRKREADELARWASEVALHWNDTMDGTGLAHHTVTAARLPFLLAPQVQSVDPGPPVTLLVRMLPGQLVDDFQSQAHRIAAGMDVPMVRISSYRHGLIKVALLEHEPLSAVMALSA
jgi:S-DNA-T family DNA segregation ATPase FtsK/SpoIIIE